MLCERDRGEPPASNDGPRHRGDGDCLASCEQQQPASSGDVTDRHASDGKAAAEQSSIAASNLVLRDMPEHDAERCEAQQRRHQRCDSEPFDAGRREVLRYQWLDGSGCGARVRVAHGRRPVGLYPADRSERRIHDRRPPHQRQAAEHQTGDCHALAVEAAVALLDLPQRCPPKRDGQRTGDHP